MPVTTKIHIQQATTSRLPEVDINNLEFGTVSADHMLIARYAGGEWQEARIEPFHDLQLSPFAMVLHYAQTIFEGLKAFRMENGNICLFRPEENWKRMNRSAERMCMPQIPEDLFIEGLKQLIRLDHEWVPKGDDKALYIRPVCFASEPRIGVKPSDEYLFLILTSPVREIYPAPLWVKVEKEYARAVAGGTGAAKCGGNYAGALYPTMKAKEEGYDQVIWTDGRTREYVEESGTMNLGFIIDGTLVTPPISDSILAGITRDSVLQLAGDLDIPAEERPVSVEEVEKHLKSGAMTEAFGIGTAAVIAPIRKITVNGQDYDLQHPSGDISRQIKQRLNDIRLGRKPDKYGWNLVVEV